jgi:membrane protease YdiL (CAAX protease family)
VTFEEKHGTGAATSGKGWLARHPLIFYFTLTYAISWSLWWLSGRVPGVLGSFLSVAGGLGPMAAAGITLSLTGGSLLEWARRIVSWRVPLRYYLYAVGLPVLAMAALNLAVIALGRQPDPSTLVARLPAYLETLLITGVIFGGLEEPGWRGFALPRLEQRYSPVVATLILGLAWGIWHVPPFGPTGFLFPLVLAFYFTWLYNRTGSVLLCILLHASISAAQDHLLLTADAPVVHVVLLGGYVLGVGLLIAITRGGLGYDHGAVSESGADHLG